MSEAQQPTKEKRSARQVSDPELIAMHEIVEILDGLDGNARRRVIMWASNRFVTGMASDDF